MGKLIWGAEVVLECKAQKNTGLKAQSWILMVFMDEFQSAIRKFCPLLYEVTIFFEISGQIKLVEMVKIMIFYSVQNLFQFLL